MIDINSIFGDKFSEADYTKSLGKISELVKQKDLAKIINRYKKDMMSTFPTYFTKLIYISLTGKKLENGELAEAVGLSALMSAPFDDAIDEEMTRNERGSLVNTGILLSLVGTINLEEQLRMRMDEDKVMEAMKFYLKTTIAATEGNENELHSKRFSFNEYIEQYKASLTAPFTLSTKVSCLLADADKETEKNLLEIADNLGLMLRLANDLNNFDKHFDNGFKSIPIKYMEDKKLSFTIANQERALNYTIRLGLKASEKCKKILNKTKLVKNKDLLDVIQNFEKCFNAELKRMT